MWSQEIGQGLNYDQAAHRFERGDGEVLLQDKEEDKEKDRAKAKAKEKENQNQNENQNKASVMSLMSDVVNADPEQRRLVESEAREARARNRSVEGSPLTLKEGRKEGKEGKEGDSRWWHGLALDAEDELRAAMDHQSSSTGIPHPSSKRALASSEKQPPISTGGADGSGVEKNSIKPKQQQFQLTTANTAKTVNTGNVGNVLSDEEFVRQEVAALSVRAHKVGKVGAQGKRLPTKPAQPAPSATAPRRK